MRSITSVLLATCALAATAGTARAQFPPEVRYDLGQRLRRFENAWAAAGKSTDPSLQERRVAARQAMQAAVTSFFSMNPARVAEQVDAAWVALVAADDGDAAELRGAADCRPEAATRLGSPDAPIGFDRGPLPEALLTADRSNLERLGFTVDTTWQAAARRAPPAPSRPADTGSFTLDTPGDFTVRMWWERPADLGAVELDRRTVSVLDAARRRQLDALLAQPLESTDGPMRFELESLTGLRRILADLDAGRAYETDVPACHLLDRARLLREHVEAAAPLRLDDHPGEHWLRIPIGVRAAAVRLHVPAHPADRETDAEDGPPPPLVLALHGMGGSEHLFFDGYGDGLAVRLAAARGWPFCAPRTLTAAGVGPLLDALATRLRFDPERIYVIGHSMGAGTAIGTVAKFPGRLRAVAALGGGGRVGDDDAARASRFLVLPGEFDFALGGARRLADELDDAGADCRYRVVPGVEHMLVVQEALPEVFAWLDG